ncbi:Transcription factor bHLH110 [Zea mays]|uniref:Transcription factor bHLH110 n=1 Tax=Zea mays TaxID=4577 RepID=A0A3L6DN11_MAIZE|nr:Transcription factor bHLH110 [Zea mays]
MAASSSSSNLSDLVQDDLLPWPSSSSSSLPFAPAAPHHSAIIGGNSQQWCQQPLALNCADRHHSDELEVLLSAQGSHHHSHSHPASPVIPPQLSSSLLTMQDHLGFQWSNCGGGGFLDTSPSTPPTNGQLQHDGHDDDKIEAEGTLITISSRPSCAGTATIAASCHDVVLHGGGGGTVLPTINISRTTTTTHTQQQQQRPFLAAPPPLPGDAFEILLASSRLCKTLLLSQAAASSSSSSVLLHDDGTISTVPSLRSESEHVAYGYGGGPPPPAPAAAHRPRGRRPSVDNYKQQEGAAACAAGAGRQWGAEHGGRAAACEERAAAAPAPARPVVVPWKKPRLEQRSGSGSSTTIVPSFKVRKEKLGDRIAALQQLVSPFGKTDTASVLMEAIGYIKFLQDQVETLSRPYLNSSRSSKKPRPTHQRGCWNASAAGEEQEDEEEETTTRRRRRPDLRSRGLCLVPLSCTSYVTNENGAWVPSQF